VADGIIPSVAGAIGWKPDSLQHVSGKVWMVTVNARVDYRDGHTLTLADLTHPNHVEECQMPLSSPLRIGAGGRGRHSEK
jgi:hypothetical protein